MFTILLDKTELGIKITTSKKPVGIASQNESLIDVKELVRPQT